MAFGIGDIIGAAAGVASSFFGKDKAAGGGGGSAIIERPKRADENLLGIRQTHIGSRPQKKERSPTYDKDEMRALAEHYANSFKVNPDG